ncbi:MAG TPA: prolyl oligopeptidase family serine peptidase [Opitutaceae bacterium]|nr:prolyl oligopeptidase family serine peptidase [Opitutaceae bacterium]
MLVSSAGAPAADYPAARRAAQVDHYFGEAVADPYRWMEELDSPETAEWIRAERACTAAAFASMPERAAIRARLTQLWDFPRFGLPQKEGGRMFYTKNEGLQNQAVLYVAEGAGQAPRALVDPNALSADGTVALAAISPSRDGRLLAYGLAVAGSDWVELRVRDVATGKDLGDALRWVKFSRPSWTNDGAGFYYCRYPEPAKGAKIFGRLSGRQLFYHAIGSEQSADRLVFELKGHPEWIFDARVTDDGRYVAISVEQNSRTQNALYYADLADPSAPRLDSPVVKLLDRFDAHYRFVGSSGTVLYVLTTLGAPRGRVVGIDLASPAGPWKEPVPEGTDSIEEVVLAGGRLVVSTPHDVESRVAVYGTDGAPLGAIALPGIGAVSGMTAKAADPELFFGFSSFLTPASITSFNVDSGAQSVFQRPEVPFDASRFETRKSFCTSGDGTRIPMFITARKGLKRDGSAPAWLYGYGGFNIAITPAFSVPTAVWIEMGGIYAQANIRGGSEYGEAWHLAGTKERKQNVFDDFIAAADSLVAQGYTRRDRLVIEGRSNGGLLIGAVLNQRPDICAVALPGVGVMDMLRFHKFTVGAPWAADYGSSDDPAGFRYLRAYSPVHNVRAGGRYPAVLVTTGDHDDRVYPAHSFKYAAEMQRAVAGVPGAGPVLIRIDSNTGHGGSTGSTPVSKAIDEWADRIGFAAHHLPAGAMDLPGGG